MSDGYWTIVADHGDGCLAHNTCTDREQGEAQMRAMYPDARITSRWNAAVTPVADRDLKPDTPPADDLDVLADDAAEQAKHFIPRYAIDTLRSLIYRTLTRAVEAVARERDEARERHQLAVDDYGGAMARADTLRVFLRKAERERDALREAARAVRQTLRDHQHEAPCMACALIEDVLPKEGT